MGGDLVFLSLGIFDRVAVVRTRTSIVRQGLGQEPQQAQKTTRFPERKTGGFVNLGTRWHCLQGYFLGYYAN